MKIIKTIAIAVLALGMFACGSSKKEGSVVGKWKVTKTEGYEAGGTGNTITFEENGKYSWDAGFIKVSGTYKLSNDTLTTTADGSTIGIDYVTKFDKGQLLMTLVTSPAYQVTYFME